MNHKNLKIFIIVNFLFILIASKTYAQSINVCDKEAYDNYLFEKKFLEDCYKPGEPWACKNMINISIYKIYKSLGDLKMVSYEQRYIKPKSKKKFVIQHVEVKINKE